MAEPHVQPETTEPPAASGLAGLLAGAPKAARFALFGAIGCLLGAIVGELLLWLLAPKAPEPAAVGQVDVLFILDVTGSMQQEIDGVREGIRDFAGQLSSRKLDARVGLIAFRDRQLGEEAEVLRFQDGPFTTDYDSFRRQVGNLVAEGGGDQQESSLDGLALAASQAFRPQATKVLLLITDAPPKLPDKETSSLEAAAEALKQNKIDQLHLVINDRDRQFYQTVQRTAPGEIFALGSGAGRQNFEKVLPVVGQKIAETTLKGLQSTSGAAPGSYGRQFVATCLWTGLLTAAVSLALIAGQNVYLKRPPLLPGQALAGAAGGLAAGVVAGGAGQLLFYLAQLVPWRALATILELPGRLAGWTILGALVARGMAFFVPNLEPRRAWLGGAAGGAAAGLGFVVAALLGDVAGRLLGAAILGAVIGLLVAVIEAAFREVWLDVRYGAKEVIKVSLGATPVKIGSDSRACTVYARGARPLAVQYKLEDGQVKCVDYATETTTVVEPNEERAIGHVMVTVRSAFKPASEAAAASESGGAANIRPAPPPPPRPKSTPPAPPTTAGPPASGPPASGPPASGPPASPPVPPPSRPAAPPAPAAAPTTPAPPPPPAAKPPASKPPAAAQPGPPAAAQPGQPRTIRPVPPPPPPRQKP